MELESLQKAWDEAGKVDPLWSVLTDPAKKGGRWTPEEFFRAGEAEIEGVMRRVATLAVKTPGRRALDFGCGPGRLTQALATRFAEVDGVDISPSMIGLARQMNRQGDRVRYHLNGADDLSLFPDPVFDFIYSSLTLQHLEPPLARRYLAEMLRVLRPGGLLVFQLPGREISLAKRIKRLLPRPLLDWYRRSRQRQHPGNRMNGAPREEVSAWITSHGARILAVDAGTSGGWESFCYFCQRE